MHIFCQAEDVDVVVGVGVVSPHDYRLHPRLVAAEFIGHSHTGLHRPKGVDANWARYSAQLHRELSRKKNTAIGGDGAIVRGGPEARHISTKAAKRKLCRLSKCDGDPPVLD